MLGFSNFWSIVDRSLNFWHKFLKCYIDVDGGRIPPWRGLPLPRVRACVNCSRDSTIRGMREVGGLIVRRECSDSKGSARFARSLTDQSSEDETISRVAKHSRHAGGRGLTEREAEQRSVAIPKQHNKSLDLYVTECKDIDRRWTECPTMGLEIVV